LVVTFIIYGIKLYTNCWIKIYQPYFTNRSLLDRKSLEKFFFEYNRTDTLGLFKTFVILVFLLIDRFFYFNFISFRISLHQLKIPGLYRYTLIFGHKSNNMFSLLNKLTLQEKLEKVFDKKCFMDKKVKTQKKIKHKNPSRSRDLNPWPLAPKGDALPLHHLVNWA